MSTRAVANVAATLATGKLATSPCVTLPQAPTTGGTNPLTNTQCLAPQITKAVLTLMFSCGLYDFSGYVRSSILPFPSLNHAVLSANGA